MPTEPIHFRHPQSSVITLTLQDFSRRVLVLNCTIEAPGTYSWVWRLNNTLLWHSNRFQIFRADAGGRVSWLVIMQLSLSDAGTYACQAVCRIDTTTKSTFREKQMTFPGKIWKHACVDHTHTHTHSHTHTHIHTHTHSQHALWVLGLARAKYSFKFAHYYSSFIYPIIQEKVTYYS